MFRRKKEQTPFDKSDLSGYIAQDVALLGYTSGLTREQTENVWEILSCGPGDQDLIAAFIRTADGLGYSYKRSFGW